MSEPEMPGWEWLGSHTPQGWPYLTRSDNIGLTPQYTQRLARTLAETVGQAPPAPDEVIDTGRVEDWTVPGTDFALVSNECYWRARDGWHSAFLVLRAVSANRTIGGQILLAQSTSLRPAHNVLGNWRANQGGLSDNCVLSASGNLYIQANPAITVPAETTLQIQITPWYED